MLKKLARMVILIGGITCAEDISAKEDTNLTIFAESNMAKALSEIARSYSKDTSTVVSVNLNSSSQLIQDIDFGEPADVFISSHEYWIDTLKQKGLVDVYNISNIAKDHLVLATSKKNHKIPDNLIAKLGSFDRILKYINQNYIPLLVDSEYTSLGRYSAKIVRDARLDRNNIYNRVEEDKRPIVSFLSENNDYYAIVLESSLTDQKDIRMIARLPNLTIYYQALVIAGDDMQEARNFLKFLKSDAAVQILKKNGFIVEEQKE